MYHYFEAKEFYNAIRVFIAAYVWMTGFGNFSYYYIRKDFSLGRFAQVCMSVLNMISGGNFGAGCTVSLFSELRIQVFMYLQLMFFKNRRGTLIVLDDVTDDVAAQFSGLLCLYSAEQ